MFGQTGILVALTVLTIALAGAFLVRSSITAGPTGKVLAFVGLCVLPALCIDMGVSFHIERSKQTRYCISCHSMETHGKSLYVANPNYLAAQHFQNHFVPPERACYTCHSNYTMYGPLKDKLDGLRYIYMTYVSTPPKVIRINGGFRNLACLHCHADARGFEDNPAHAAIMGSLKTNRVSCISCHSTVHNASEVSHLKMWVEGDAPTSLTSGSSSSATGSSAGGATADHGKGLFDSHGCGGCHGESGGGGSGPALTHISSKYPPAKLTAVLKAPTAGMKAGGMAPLTLNPEDMTALVAYVTGLGGTPAGSAATPSASGASSSAPAKPKPAATTASSKAPAAGSAGGATASVRGKGIFDSHGCGGCHGASGGGGSGPALTHISSKYPQAKLTALLKAPTAKMKAAGMAALTVKAADMKALVSYLIGLGVTPAGSAAGPPASGASAPAPAKPETAATAGPSKAPAAGPAGGATASVQGKGIFDSQGCGGCHGASGGGGTGPALTHISSKYPPAKLTAVLKAPTDAMKAAGMAALTVNAADMESLVSYLTSLGGTPAGSAATPSASGASSPAPVKPEPAATAGPSKAPATTPTASGASSPTPAKAGPAATPGPSKAESKGKTIFKTHGCAGCHGTDGVAGTAAASALAGTGKSYAPALLTTMLQHPTARMQQGGMPPVSMSGDELKALVTYVSAISASKGSSP